MADARSLLIQVGFALAVTALASLIRWALDPFLGASVPLGTFFGAVALAAWVCDPRGAILSVVLGYVAANLLFVEPRGTLTFTASVQAGLLVYLFSSSIILTFAWLARSARRANAQRYLADERSVPEVKSKDQPLEVSRLGKLVDVSLEISVSLSLAEPLRTTLQLVSDRAREILGCHMAAIGTTIDPSWRQAVQAVSLSDKFAAWRSYEEPPDGTGIYSIVCRTNQPLRLTEEELLRHPDFRGFGYAGERHPPLRGWMGIPLVGRDGRNLGVLHASDKFEGELSSEDEWTAVQLAAMASVAVENHYLYEGLQEADRRKNEFMATLAHELRNPLSALIHALEVIRLAGENQQSVRRARTIIETQAQQMMRLLDDLMEASRIGRGWIALHLARVELAEALRRAIEVGHPLSESCGHELVVRLPSEPIFVDADLTRLIQIFSNLLSNACKYTPRGGRIAFTADRLGPEVIVKVQDNGIGIDKEQLPRVFDLFARPGHAPGGSSGGLGIGLAVVRDLVKMHGGKVEAASDGASRGSEFTVRLHVAV